MIPVTLPMRNEKTQTGCLGCTRDYTTQLLYIALYIGNNIINHYKALPIKQPVRTTRFFFRGWKNDLQSSTPPFCTKKTRRLFVRNCTFIGTSPAGTDCANAQRSLAMGIEGRRLVFFLTSLRDGVVLGLNNLGIYTSELSMSPKMGRNGPRY